MTASERLRAAAAGVRTAWTQNMFIDARGARCAGGWLLLDDLRSQESALQACLRAIECPDYMTAIFALSDAVGEGGIPGWNDVAGQTAANVAATMEVVAAVLDMASSPAPSEEALVYA